MKKKNWLLTIAFAVLSLTIISTCVIGSTYAKFTSNVEGGAKVQAAGFLVTGGTASVGASVGLVAPGVSQHKDATIEYFSQVVTEISVAQAGATVTGTGVFASAAWTALLAEYKDSTNGIGKDDTNITTSTTLADIFTVTLGSNTVAEDFAAAVVTAASTEGMTLTTSTSGGHTTISAMPADAETTLEVTVPVTVTWTSKGNLFDTFLGNKIAELATADQNAAVSEITVSIPLVAEQYIAS
ncbi:MAG: hypothetical protein K6F08_03995 [bacterium]|nr:hypothetical protein [bacterium]